MNLENNITNSQLDENESDKRILRMEDVKYIGQFSHCTKVAYLFDKYRMEIAYTEWIPNDPAPGVFSRRIKKSFRIWPASALKRLAMVKL